MKKIILAIFLVALLLPTGLVHARKNVTKSRKSTIDLHAAREKVLAKSKELMRCFNAFVPDELHPAPTRVQIWVEIEVAPSGRQVGSSIISSTVSDIHPEECMVKVLSGITYPKPANGSTSPLLVKLTFRRGADEMKASTF